MRDKASGSSRQKKPPLNPIASPRTRTPYRIRKRIRDVEEEHIQRAVEYLRTSNSLTPHYTEACRKFGILSKTQVVRARFLGTHASADAAHDHQKYCPAVVEEVILDWMILAAEEGHPWDDNKLLLKVEQLTSKRPSRSWAKLFRQRHADVLKFCGTSGLDPKRAQAFNPTQIGNHFKEYGEVCCAMHTGGINSCLPPTQARARYQYKIWNIYNYDEKGNQLGGGRQHTGKRFFIPRWMRTKYKVRDDNKETVTVIECCSADGTMLQPGFIFRGGKKAEAGGTYEYEWFDEDGIS